MPASCPPRSSPPRPPANTARRSRLRQTQALSPPRLPGPPPEGRYAFSLPTVLLLGLLHSVSATPSSSEGFNYVHSALDWEGLCASGSRQSPINIVRQEAKAASHNLTLNYQASSSYTLTNNGHTIMLKPDGAANNTLVFDSATYALAQAHAHEVSEHTFEGFFGAMEFHYVHTSIADPSTYLVLAITYHLNTSGGDNPFISAYIDAAPQVEEANITVNRPVDLLSQVTLSMSSSPAFTVRAMDAVPITSAPEQGTAASTLYTYEGSLTTPPCAESVTWLVVDPGQGPAISVAQYQKFLDIMANTTGGSAINNRPPLPSQGRNVQVFKANLGLNGDLVSPGASRSSFAVRKHASAAGSGFVCSLLVWGLALAM